MSGRVNTSYITQGVATVFSYQEAKTFLDVLELAKENFEAQNIVVTTILLNNCMVSSIGERSRCILSLKTGSYQENQGLAGSRQLKSKQGEALPILSLYKVSIAVMCCGTPPKFSQRFDYALENYKRTLQTSTWPPF